MAPGSSGTRGSCRVIAKTKPTPYVGTTLSARHSSLIRHRLLRVSAYVYHYAHFCLLMERYYHVVSKEAYTLKALHVWLEGYDRDCAT